MTISHIALFKARQSMMQADGIELTRIAKSMLDEVPGLLSIEVGPALDLLEVTKMNSHGYEWAVVVTVDKTETLGVYAAHPIHDDLVKTIRKIFTQDMLLFDLEY